MIKTKIKILRDSNFKQLECKVNTFIKDKCIINISHELTVWEECDRQIDTLIIIILYDEYSHCGYLDHKSIMDFNNYKIN